VCAAFPTGGPVLAKTSEGKAAEVEQLIAPSLLDMGYDIVRVQLSGERRAKLQVMVERRDGGDMTVDDCAAVSRAVGALLDVADPISGAYVLEVSSPGIDRPLTRLGDFERFAGHDARVEMHTPIAGRRRYRGRIIGLDADRVRLATTDGEIALPFADLAKAKLDLTEELLAAKRSPGPNLSERDQTGI
jgi:ribosome maturation factor RimP